jgi:hypothetical protein
LIFLSLFAYFAVVQKNKINIPNEQQTIEWDAERNTAFTCLKHFSKLVEMARPRFETRVPSSLSTGAAIAGGGSAGVGSSSSGTAQAQGTGECSSSHNKVEKLRLHLIIVMPPSLNFSIFPLFFLLLHFLFLSHSLAINILYIVNVNATIDKDVVGVERRRERERELMRSNSERDRSTNSMGREHLTREREFNDHHQPQQQQQQTHHHHQNYHQQQQQQRDVSLAKYSCRGEVNLNIIEMKSNFNFTFPAGCNFNFPTRHARKARCSAR